MPAALEQLPTLPVAVGNPPDDLRNGDRLTRAEFHERYERLPAHLRAELIGGIVYMSSPMKRKHGTNTPPLASLFLAYENATPGTESGESLTILLDDDNEPQPDLCLRILPDHGGQTRDTADGYISGAPELLCEVADSTRSLDLNAKKTEYARAGVLEYLVLNLRDDRLHWFDLKGNRELIADSDGILRIRTLPGLWIDPVAVIARDLRALLATLDRGLASADHAAFVAKLASAKLP